ncbi:MAG: hypothetical protein QME90_18915, partial [Thermodesulfobacteriota bacterium]|nr:hypothetical protein [Thermodesulfobacteriota bacterium]
SPGRGLLLMVIAVALLFGMLAEAKAAPNFKGKVITLVIPISVGGGTDTAARLISRHLGKYIPGNPVIVVRNIVGAAALIGVNYAWAAKPNGLTLVLTDGKANIQNLVRPKGTDFKLEEMSPILVSATGTVFYARPGIIKEPKDILTGKGVISGLEDPSGGTGFSFVCAKELLGVRFEKEVWGYPGSGPRRLAFLAGEINLSVESSVGYKSSVKPYVERGQAVPVFQSGILDEKGNVIRDVPDIPTTPEIYQQIHGKAPSGLAWDMYKVMVAGRTFGKMLLFPPKTPAEIVNIYRKAAVEMVNSLEFHNESEKIEPGARYLVGETLARTYLDGISARPEVVEFIKKVLSEKYGIVLD